MPIEQSQELRAMQELFPSEGLFTHTLDDVIGWLDIARGLNAISVNEFAKTLGRVPAHVLSLDRPETAGTLYQMMQASSRFYRRYPEHTDEIIERWETSYAS